MRRLIMEIRIARRLGLLPRRFRPVDVRQACPGWASRTYNNFLPKHRSGKPGQRDTELFMRNEDGSYSLIQE